MTPSRGPTSEIGVTQLPPRGSVNANVALPLVISMWQCRNGRSSALHESLNEWCNLAPHWSTNRLSAIFRTDSRSLLCDKYTVSRPVELARLKHCFLGRLTSTACALSSDINDVSTKLAVNVTGGSTVSSLAGRRTSHCQTSKNHGFPPHSGRVKNGVV
jgi:hypothetical protein